MVRQSWTLKRPETEPVPQDGLPSGSRRKSYSSAMAE